MQSVKGGDGGPAAVPPPPVHPCMPPKAVASCQLQTTCFAACPGAWPAEGGPVFLLGQEEAFRLSPRTVFRPLWGEGEVLVSLLPHGTGALPWPSLCRWLWTGDICMPPSVQRSHGGCTS